MATKCVSGAGYRATCIDIKDHEAAGYALGEGSVFDINSASGFVLLSVIVKTTCMHIYMIWAHGMPVWCHIGFNPP